MHLRKPRNRIRRGRVGTEQLAQIVAVLEEFGYVYVPERLLEHPYTGANTGVDGIHTWAHRFFDWI